MTTPSPHTQEPHPREQLQGPDWALHPRTLVGRAEVGIRPPPSSKGTGLTQVQPKECRSVALDSQPPLNDVSAKQTLHRSPPTRKAATPGHTHQATPL